MQAGTQTAAKKPAIHPWRDELVEENLDLARNLAHRLSMRLPPWEDRGDLLGAAYLGLVEASRRFDKNRGLPFAAFAKLRIVGAILDHLRHRDKISKRERRRKKQKEKTKQRLTAQNGRIPSHEDLARTLGLSLSDYHDYYNMPPVLEFSLDLLDRGVADDILAGGQSPEAVVRVRRLRRRLTEAIDRLPEKERTVVSLVYGEGLKYKQISHLLDVTESRICQIHRQACRRLRTYLDGDEVHHSPISN